MEKESRKVYSQIAITGYKHYIKKFTQLLKLKTKGIFLKLQYKAAEISYKREIRKINPKKRTWKRAVLKYLGLTVAGILLFLLVSIPVGQSRGYKAIGGEGILLLLPVIYLLGTSLRERPRKR